MVLECQYQSITCLLAKATSHSLHEKFLIMQQLQQEKHQHTQTRMSRTRLFKANFINRAD